MSDINTIHDEILFFAEKEGKKDFELIKEDNFIKVLGKSEKLFTLSIHDSVPFTKSVVRIETENEHLKRFGDFDIVCYLKEYNKYVSVKCIIVSTKSPKLLIRIFIMLYVKLLMLLTRKNEKLFIRRIEESA